MTDKVPIASFFDPALAQSLSAFALTTRKSMLGSVSGKHQSPHRGSSVEFAEYRRYQPGDDLRRLDWRAYGRSDRYYVKEFEADTNLRLVLVVDCSGSMGFGEKMMAARKIAATLASLATGQGDAAGLLCCGEFGADEQLSWIPPRRISGQVSVLLERLARLHAKGATTLAAQLHDLAEQIRERALIIVVSDLLFEPAELQSAIEHLAFRNHDLAVFHLLDPQELRPEWDRPIRLDDMEGGQPLVVDPEEIAAGYQEAVRDYLNEIETITRQRSVDYQSVVLHQPVDEALKKFLAKRTASSSGDRRS